MGLFGKKEVCACCGGKIGALAIKYHDGKICHDCVKNVGGITDSSFSISSTEEFLEFKKYITERQEMDFPVNNKKEPIEVNRQLKLIHFPNQLGRVFRFDELSSVEIIEDGESVSKGGIGSAAAGGLLFGGAGAVVGSVTGKKQKAMVNRISVRVNFNNRWIQTEEIVLLSTQTARNSFMYRATIDNAHKLKQMLESCAQPSNEAPASNTASNADEIRKYKQLLDDGIISQEEFDAKKKQLLNL